MKQPTLITKIIMFTIFLAGCVYLIGAGWQILTDPFTTIMTYSYTVYDTIEAEGWLVREEQVIGGSGNFVDTLPDQGERVSKGEVVALIYQDETALDRSYETRALELEIEQISYTLLRGEDSWDNSSLDTAIATSMASLRGAVSMSDWSSLEEDSLELQSMVLQRLGDASSSASLSQQLVSAQAQLASLEAASTWDTTRVYAPVAGNFSALVDGYESILTPDSLNNLTPTSFYQLTSQSTSAGDNQTGKLVTDITWYLALCIPEEEANSLVQGYSIPVRFSHDWSGTVNMTIELISAPYEGEVAVVLSSNRSLADTILLRCQQVELILEEHTGIRVPKQAIRTIDVTTTDPDTGEQIATGEKEVGIYVLTGAVAEWRAINILVDEGDYCLVETPLPSNPTSTQLKTQLRAGDEVIVSATDLYDGKVVSS